MLDKSKNTKYNNKVEKNNKFRGVAQLGARDIWDVEAAGSNPVTPTKIGNPFTKVDGFLILYYSFFIIQYSSFIKTDFRNEQ